MTSEETATLDTAAFAAWPAEELVALDGWWLRHTHGVTRRANSVWPCGTAGQLPLAARIAKVEEFYRQRGLPARFQVSPLSIPMTLDRKLEAAGYVQEAPVAVQTCAAVALANAAANTRVDVDVFDGPNDVWFDLSARKGRFAAVEDTYRGLLARLLGRASFALARLGGEPVAVALGVRDHAHFGIFSMLTIPEGRRRGAARSLCRALGQRACAVGASTIYLQVERENVAALALYRSLGFVERYGYHYRVQR